jgi:two-component system response regulator
LSRTQAELEQANERLMAALKASRCGTWRWDIAEDRVLWDDALLRVFGVDQAPATVAGFAQLIHPGDRDRIVGAVQACLAGGSEVEYEFRTHASGPERWIYDRSSLTRDAEGRPLYMTGACFDVTDRKRVEQERDQALEKHRWFLKELNHRTKNHLQLITAMLGLQSGTMPSDEAKRSFAAAIRRINVIADLHGRLYRNDTQEWVEAASYLVDLCDGLRQSFLGDGRIALACHAADAQLTLDQAVPMGLIVNELVTNAIKHGFAKGGDGRIEVSFTLDGPEAELRVTDNGRGLGDDGSAKQGLGRRLVQALAIQLGATVEVDGRDGTSHRLRFPAGNGRNAGA